MYYWYWPKCSVIKLWHFFKPTVVLLLRKIRSQIFLFHLGWSKLCIQMGVCESITSPSPVLPYAPFPQLKTFPNSSTMAAWWVPAEMSLIRIICISFVFLVFGSLSYTLVTLYGCDNPAYLKLRRCFNSIFFKNAMF